MEHMIIHQKKAKTYKFSMILKTNEIEKSGKMLCM